MVKASEVKAKLDTKIYKWHLEDEEPTLYLLQG